MGGGNDQRTAVFAFALYAQIFSNCAPRPVAAHDVPRPHYVSRLGCSVFKGGKHLVSFLHCSAIISSLFVETVWPNHQ